MRYPLRLQRKHHILSYREKKMNKLIHFCNKTRGSQWWLVATVASVLIPVITIMYTFYQLEDIHPWLIRKVFVGCDYSLLKFISIDTGLSCESPFLENTLAENFLFTIDIILIYALSCYTSTFFRVWRGQVFLSDPSQEFCSWNVYIMRFNSEKEVSFFRLPFTKKGYWLKPLGNPCQFSPVK